MPLIVVVVGDRASKINRNKVDGHVQNVRAAITSRRQVLHSHTTNRVWSYHQSCVIVCQAVARSAFRPVTNCPDWLNDQSATLPTNFICNRSPLLVVRVSVRLLTIGGDAQILMTYDRWHDQLHDQLCDFFCDHARLVLRS